MGSTLRYILAVVLILLFAIFGTVFLVRQFTRDSKGTIETARIVHTADLLEASDARVVWIQQGRVVGSDRRREVRITVTPTERKAEIITGYDNKVEKTVTFANDKAAFTTFLISLENIRFGQERTVAQVDERGVCALGQTYVYEIHQGNDQKSRLWSDSCSSSNGTYGGKTTVARQLFQSQITGYQKFIAGVRF